jgi:hypothetical protein
MIVTVCHEFAISVRLQAGVLYGVSARGITEREIGDTQRLSQQSPVVIAAARVEVREAFG